MLTINQVLDPTLGTPDRPSQGPVKLTADQQSAANAFFQFLLSPEREFSISGAAGVGKTFLTAHLMHDMLLHYHDMCKIMGIQPKNWQVQVTATTNKAAQVISEALKTQVPTIQSFLGLKVKQNFQTGETSLTRAAGWRLIENTILFIEEASFIDSELDAHIRDATLDCKIVYIGDRFQLAPVNEPMSPVYRRQIVTHDLFTPVRNAGQPALVALCDQLRNTVSTQEFHPIVAVPGVIDCIPAPDAQALVDATFIDPDASARILAFTNRTVVDYNDYIRQLRGLPSTYEAGDRVINNNVLQMPSRLLSIEEEFTITKLDPRVKTNHVHGASFDFQFGELTSKHQETFKKVPIPTDREHFLKVVSWLAKQRLWKDHFRLKETFADLRPRDAATAYKAQGSTYDTVFVDVTDIGSCNVPSQVARMLYVAASRARNRIILFGTLPEKYGGLIYN